MVNDERISPILFHGFENDERNSPISFHGFEDNKSSVEAISATNNLDQNINFKVQELFKHVVDVGLNTKKNSDPKEYTNEIAEKFVHHRINDIACKASEIEDTLIKQEMNEKMGTNDVSSNSRNASMVQISKDCLKILDEQFDDPMKYELRPRAEPKKSPDDVNVNELTTKEVEEIHALTTPQKKQTQKMKLLSSPKYCICQGPEEGSMIGCDFCDEWYHTDCLNLTKQQVSKLAKEKWACQKCLPNVEPSCASKPIKKEDSVSSVKSVSARFEKAYADFKNNAQDIRCKQCDYEAWDFSDLSTHISETHNESKTISCIECGFESSKKNILRHVESVHKKNPFIYSWCYIPLLSENDHFEEAN